MAEDLGSITPAVRQLRRQLEIPCTRVLQFAFDDAASEHLPHNLEPDTFLYTGTHDNDTSAGWLGALEPALRQRVSDYTGSTDDDSPWPLIRLALTSVASDVVLPLQDVLGLGSEARMNLPSVPDGNWAWRAPELPGEEATRTLVTLTGLSGRLGRDARSEDSSDS